MKPPTIPELREKGFKIKSTHFRLTNRGGPFSRRRIDEENVTPEGGQRLTRRNHEIEPCGGRVEIILDGPDGFSSVGIAECNDKDNFNKKIGSAMALGRAWKPFQMIAEGASPGMLGWMNSRIFDRTDRSKLGTIRGGRYLGDPKKTVFVIEWDDKPKQLECRIQNTLLSN